MAEDFAEHFRQLGHEGVLLDHATGIGRRGWVGKRGAGGQGGLASVGHVADADGQFHGRGRGGGETSAFDCREVFAHGVDFIDGRAAFDEQTVELLQVG